MIFRFLASFHYHQRTDLQQVADGYHGPCEVFADSGAFSAYSLGATISLAEYAAWLTEWDQLLTVKATLDVIGDPDATMRNTRLLEDKGHRVLPVFHVGTPWDRLEALCAEYDYVALGGMVPHTRDASAVLRWLVRCFTIGRDTGTVFHGFGQTNITTLKALPFYSVDSSTGSKVVRFGEMMLWDEPARRFVVVPVGNAAAAKAHGKLLRAHGAPTALVGTRGFANAKSRTPERYAAERAVLLGAPAAGFTRFGEHLIRRHKVPPPPSHPGTGHGTQVYLAEVPSNLPLIAAHLNALEGT